MEQFYFLYWRLPILMKNRRNNDQNNQGSNEIIRASELALIGELVTTLGYIISTTASVLALEEERQGNGDNKNMQKQIDDLTNEVRKIKKQINHGKPRFI